MRIKLKLTLAVMAVLLLAVGAYPGDYIWQQSVDKSIHGFQTYVPDGYGGAGKLIIGAAADTTNRISVGHFKWFVIASKITTDAGDDSCHVRTYLDKSTNGTDWVVIDSLDRSLTIGDTLYAEKLWPADSLHTLYLRWRNVGKVASCSCYVWQKHLLKQ